MNVRKPGPRLVGTWDEEGTLLYSQGFKNFKDKMPCNWCSQKKAMMHRYALAKKGVPPVFSATVFCSAACHRKRQESPNAVTPQGLA